MSQQAQPETIQFVDDNKDGEESQRYVDTSEDSDQRSTERSFVDTDNELPVDVVASRLSTIQHNQSKGKMPTGNNKKVNTPSERKGLVKPQSTSSQQSIVNLRVPSSVHFEKRPKTPSSKPRVCRSCASVLQPSSKSKLEAKRPPRLRQSKSVLNIQARPP